MKTVPPHFKITELGQSAQIRLRLNFVRWCLVSVGHHFAIYFTLPFQHLELLRGA